MSLLGLEGVDAVMVEEPNASNILEEYPHGEAGVKGDALAVAVERVSSELIRDGKNWITLLSESMTPANSATVLHIIGRITSDLGNMLINIDPAIDERAERRMGDYAGSSYSATGVISPTQMTPLNIGGPTNSETFGASMMQELGGALAAQSEAQNKLDINMLFSALEKARELGQTAAVTALEKKIDEVLESGDFVAKAKSGAAKQPEVFPMAMLPEAVGEEDNDQEVVSPE